MKRFLGLSLALCALISIFSLPGSAASSRPIEDGVYCIISVLNEQKAVDVTNCSSSNGANIQLYDFNETGAQRF